MSTPLLTRQHVVELIDELPNDSLPEVAQFIEFLRFKAVQLRRPSSPEEESLLTIIHRRLPPDEQQRLRTLRSKLEAEQLTEAERMDLEMYVERIEREDVERAEALVKLAELRHASLTQLMRDLQLGAVIDDD